MLLLAVIKWIVVDRRIDRRSFGSNDLQYLLIARTSLVFCSVCWLQNAERLLLDHCDRRLYRPFGRGIDVHSRLPIRGVQAIEGGWKV